MPANRILPRHLLLTYHLNSSPNRERIKKCWLPFFLFLYHFCDPFSSTEQLNKQLKLNSSSSSSSKAVVVKSSKPSNLSSHTKSKPSNPNLATMVKKFMEKKPSSSSSKGVKIRDRARTWSQGGGFIVSYAVVLAFSSIAQPAKVFFYFLFFMCVQSMSFIGKDKIILFKVF